MTSARQLFIKLIQQDDMHVLRARSETDKFKSELKLSDKQYQQAYDINLKYAKDQNNIRNLGKSRKATNKALKASEKKKTQELKMVLDENQFKVNISHQMCHLYHSQMCRIYHS